MYRGNSRLRCLAQKELKRRNDGRNDDGTRASQGRLPTEIDARDLRHERVAPAPSSRTPRPVTHTQGRCRQCCSARVAAWKRAQGRTMTARARGLSHFMGLRCPYRHEKKGKRSKTHFCRRRRPADHLCRASPPPFPPFFFSLSPLRARRSHERKKKKVRKTWCGAVTASVFLFPFSPKSTLGKDFAEGQVFCDSLSPFLHPVYGIPADKL